MTPKVLVSDLVGHLLNEIDRDDSVAPKFERVATPEEIWEKLLFCVLSSQVRAGAAKSATVAILAEVPFFEEILSSVDVHVKLRTMLGRHGLRYRFPEARSAQIANSWFAFAQVQDQFYQYLDTFSGEREARAAIAKRFPGLGLKQASMFLRDIGFSARLCVIDTHILWYCDQMYPYPVRGPLTPKRYLQIEELLLESADRFQIAPNILDTVIWVAVRAMKAQRCTMRFA